MRDAFIRGLSDFSFRKRLLEEEEALTKAELLDRAQQQFHNFIDSNPVENGGIRVFCASTLRSLKSIPKNAISVVRSLTLKKEDFAQRKTKCVLNAEKVGHFRRVCQRSPLERMAVLSQDDN